jgi:hypothetical protein
MAVLALVAVLGTTPAAVAAPATGPVGVETYPGDRAMVVAWRSPAPGASSHVATATDGTRRFTCTATTEAFCTITGLTNATAYRVEVAGRDASGTGPATGAPGVAVPRGRCTPVTPGPANPALAAAITARLASDAAFQAVFGAELSRLATCNSHIDTSLRTGIADAVRAEPNGTVATSLRDAITKRAQVQAAVAADPNGPLARLVAATLRIAAPVVTWPAWVRSSEGNYVADGVGATYGRGTGQLVTYTVEVHPSLTAELGPLLATTDVAFGDARRSWPAAGQWQLRRINDPAAARIRIILAPPDVTQRMCAAAGIVTNGDVSCWDGKRTNLNSDRWFNGGTEFTDVAAYRIYLINHEFGHGLGYDHVACSPRGSLAKVMQPQTLSLRGCRGNGWPYPNGA